jgi:hypothetical protein
MDVHPATVADFRCLIDATGYVTVAERLPDPAVYPDADPSLLMPGSLVLSPALVVDRPPCSRQRPRDTQQTERHARVA